jgi:hypothetical protein
VPLPLAHTHPYPYPHHHHHHHHHHYHHLPRVYQVRVFGEVRLTQAALLGAMASAALQSLVEGVRLQTLGRAGEAGTRGGGVLEGGRCPCVQCHTFVWLHLIAVDTQPLCTVQSCLCA